MSPELPALEAQALQLPAPDRESLAAALLQSLDQAPLDQIDTAWIEEAERRYRDWQTDKTTSIAGEGFFDGIKQELGWR